MSGEDKKLTVFEAARQGNLALLRYFIERTAVNLDTGDLNGNTLLWYAVESDDESTLQYLVERVGLNPLKGNTRGVTPYDRAHELEKEKSLAYFQKVCGFTWGEGYHNPIRRGFFPDPSIVRVGEDFYMVNSTFHFFPCIPISHSRDLVHWEIIGYAITNPTWAKIDELDGGRGYWAPDISYCDGTFYITATLRLNEGAKEKRIQMVTSSRNPQGPYREPSWIHEDGIDPSIFHDKDGRKYMLLNRGARILELNADCTRQISEAELLWLGDCRRNPEGPHLIRRGDYYYLFLAEGGTGMGHRVTVARSRILRGRYEPCPWNPILQQTDENAQLQCCGHGMPVELSDGRWYLVYLCLRRSANEYGFCGRETSLDQLEWTMDGWPIVNHKGEPSCFEKIPILLEKQSESNISLNIEAGYPRWKGKDWITPRPLLPEFFKVVDDQLLLRGNGVDLCSKKCRSIWVERQQETNFCASCSLKIIQAEEGESAGLVCYYDENSYIKYGVERYGRNLKICLRSYVGDRYSEEYIQLIDGKTEKITLQLAVNGMARTFSWKGEDGTSQVTAKLQDTKFLASEGLAKGKRFTGATVGMYVSGNASAQFFDWNTVWHPF